MDVPYASREKFPGVDLLALLRWGGGEGSGGEQGRERGRKRGREGGRERRGKRGRKGKLVNVFLSACFYESLH